MTLLRRWWRSQPAPAIHEPVDPTESLDAIHRAAEARLQAEALVQDAEATARVLVWHREQNHFAERIKAAFEEDRW